MGPIRRLRAPARWIALGAIFALLPGCGFVKEVLREVRALVIVLQGGKNPLQHPLPPRRAAQNPSDHPPSAPQAQYSSAAAQRALSNGELLHEMYQVVFVREPWNRAEFGSLVNALNQGASLEGVYNGLIHSADFRKLETSYAGAAPKAYEEFGQELAELELALPAPTRFEPTAAMPLPQIDPTSVDAAGSVSVVEYPKPGTTPAAESLSRGDLKELAEKYEKEFSGASIFTLKRVLGDEALKVVESKRRSPDELAMWYSKWAAQMASRNVDFGVSLRNRADERFHYDWARSVSEDRVIWEILNRLHRLMNAANSKKA